MAAVGFTVTLEPVTAPTVGEIDSDEAPVTDQASVTAPPEATELGEAVKESIDGFGSGAVTVTSTLCMVVPAELIREATVLVRRWPSGLRRRRSWTWTDLARSSGAGRRKPVTT